MISRNNILELTSALGNEKFHSAILTCYTFDPVYFYEIHLPVLRKLGISNIIVMVDAGQYDQIMETVGLYADMLSGYTVVRQVTHSATGVFHPKIHLLLGEKRGAIYIGSGNLTHSGMSLNDEVWAELYYDAEKNETIPLFKQIWEYLRSLPSNEMTKTQQTWMLDTTPWLREAINKDDVDLTPTIDGVTLQLIANTPNLSIGDTIKECMRSEETESITVVSPFYDDDAYSFGQLVDGHEIKDKTLFVDTQNGRCPQTCPKDTIVYDWSLKERESRQKLHAKIIQVITQTNTFLIMGSANATRNAMGFNRNGYNDEACLLIKDSKRTDYIKELGIRPSDEPLSEADLADARSNQPLSETQPKNTHIILWASLEENKLTLRLQDTTDINGVMIGLYDNKEERICCVPYAESVKIDADIHPVWAVLLRENRIISNSCLIQDQDVILNFHPNEKNKKLLPFLDKDAPWENDLGHILQYLSFDDTEDAPNEGFKSSSNKSTRERVTEVDKAQYDMTPMAIKSRMATNTNLLLVEFLSSVFQQGRKKESQSDLTAQEQDDEDNVSSSRRTLTDDVRYANHVNRLLNSGIQHFLNRLPKVSDPIMKWKEDRYANQNEYSAMLCGVFLALFDKSKEPAIIAKRKGLLVKFLSISCLAFFHGWSYNDSYRIGKMKGMLRNFCGRALLLLTHYNWKREQEDEVALIALNIFNQYKYLSDENHSATSLIEDALTELLKDAERNGLSISNQSLLLLRETFSRFSIYLAKADNRVRYQDVEAGDFIYVGGVGFGSFVKGKINAAGYFQYTYNYPCFEREMVCSTKTTIKII